MHTRFGRNHAVAVKMTPVQIHDDQVAGRHHAFVEARRSRKDAMGVETDREIALPGDDVAAFIQPAPDETNILAVLFLGARGAIA
jgi:hypothetical protein